MKTEENIILTYGTFDLLHFGHIELFRRAKDLGDKLIVGLSTDEFNKKKEKQAVYNYDQRLITLSAVKFIDEIIPEENWEQKIEDIKRLNVTTFLMGDDWKGKFDFLKEYCNVVYLPRTPEVSTSGTIKNIISKKDNYKKGTD